MADDNNELRLPPVRQRRRAQEPSYEVGYRRPPKHSQFKPGQSGNPKGRPKASKGLRTIVEETLHEKIPIRTNGKDRKVTRLEALVLKQMELASKGDLRALDKIIQLYRTLVPEEKSDRPAENAALTKTDKIALEEFTRIILAAAQLERKTQSETGE
jgi:triphosphoribosyl-dephospho-CoA synthetase